MISQEDIKTKTAEELVRSSQTTEQIIDAVIAYCKNLELRIESLENK
jgi:hypothetical protein